MADETLDRAVATAILGIDTLWGGDVMSPSGTGRFIADSWFADVPLPESYTHPAAARVRESGGASADEPDRDAVHAYLDAVDVSSAIASVVAGGAELAGTRGSYLAGLGLCLEVMWDLVMELVNDGEPVPYERCVEASTAAQPTPSDPVAKRERLADLLAAAGYATGSTAQLLEAVDAWRTDRAVPPASLATLSAAFIAELEARTTERVMPLLPIELHEVPRSNVRLLPIEDAWFSGSMNYIGRARSADGRPEYEATYEINASLEISIPEFAELISHEVVPGHVMTFALLQHLYVSSRLGFEGTVLTMNSRYSTLAEGIANNAHLIAHGVTEIEDLQDRDLQVAILLSRLQDDAKNQASYLTWKEGVEQSEVAQVLRRDFLVSEERAEKLSGPWARHALLGRMYLPAYRTGADVVADLRRQHPPEVVLPALYGCKGMVDIATIFSVLP